MGHLADVSTIVAYVAVDGQVPGVTWFLLLAILVARNMDNVSTAAVFVREDGMDVTARLVINRYVYWVLHVDTSKRT